MYFDLDFLPQLQNQFGATGDLAAQYIVAHEYGHHVQNLLGINEQMQPAPQQQDPSRANQYSVALELQADCFAGVWAATPSRAVSSTTRRRSSEALNAAAAVGDDRIQQQTQGRVDPESLTHGTSAQRVSVVPARLRHRRPQHAAHVRSDRLLRAAGHRPRRQRERGRRTRRGRCRSGGATTTAAAMATTQ